MGCTENLRTVAVIGRRIGSRSEFPLSAAVEIDGARALAPSPNPTWQWVYDAGGLLATVPD